MHNNRSLGYESWAKSQNFVNNKCPQAMTNVEQNRFAMETDHLINDWD
jgi:hypothetical protein